LVNNLTSNLDLATHGIDCYHAALKVQHGQQLGQGSDLIAFGSDFELG
jgi:hypothetical protein